MPGNLFAGFASNRLVERRGGQYLVPRNGTFEENLNRATRSRKSSSQRCLSWVGLLALPVALAFASPQDFRSPLILSPYSVSFGYAQVGKTSPPQAVTLVNTGVLPVHVTAVSVTGDFTQTNDCPVPPASLAKNDACQIQIVFRPSAGNLCSGTLTVSHDAAGSALTVLVSGTGTSGAAETEVSPSSLDFHDQKIGTPSAPQIITLSNPGKAPAFVSNIDAGGDFTIMPSSTCMQLDGPLAANSNCTVIVTFTPLGSGKREGRVAITDNAEKSPQIISLTGTGSP